ncbi:hypothetical protein GQ55_9G645600 [Panicum hallii var. hallii]|uniref:Uncharacterized protein n=1 Tax=Panicum hallii var. hallii TaxID=1504633 RepID=A0A2T7CIQ9_9POAL|nr:hypothetical protein GQ55_9G645600 [Panicum hallii var. hallii]
MKINWTMHVLSSGAFSLWLFSSQRTVLEASTFLTGDLLHYSATSIRPCFPYFAWLKLPLDSSAYWY